MPLGRECVSSDWHSDDPCPDACHMSARMNVIPPLAGDRQRIARELHLAKFCLILTLVAASLFIILELRPAVLEFLDSGAYGLVAEAIGFAVLALVLVYGALAHQLSRLGCLKRLLGDAVTGPRRSLGNVGAAFGRAASSVCVLIPSYKEEPQVVLRTLLSAALQDYPRLHIALLIDDPSQPADGEARRLLSAARRLPDEVAALLAEPAERFADAVRALACAALPLPTMAAELAALHREAAAWILRLAGRWPRLDPADRFFADRVLPSFAAEHQREAQFLRSFDGPGARLAQSRLLLANRFAADLTSFERKAYVNLPHEPNKAMNLNAYIGCMGGAYRTEPRVDGVHLLPAGADTAADLVLPGAEFLVTLDADSVLLAGYVDQLMAIMEAPEHGRFAVVQTPYAAFENAPPGLERLAGATTDIQLILHQGFTHHDATFWVGANAVLRRAALDDIREDGHERGFPISRFIQDRTVIEDTESTIDLIARGWHLHNHPARLAFSATPPDFGSLAIQRRRWACGGLLVIPKLLAFLASRLTAGQPVAAVFGQAVIRLHYLGSLFWVPLAVILLLFYPFSDESMATLWLPLAAVPYFFVYGRDLSFSGYNVLRDLPRVYALNLLLIPVHLTGAVASLWQAITGRKVPFRRTPKVAGRTASSPGLLLVVWALPLWCAVCAVSDLWQGNLMHAAFVGANGALFAYGAWSLVGWRNTLEDLAGAWPPLAALNAAGIGRTLRQPPRRRLVGGADDDAMS